MGVSLWQPVSYDEAELLVSEALTDPASHLTRAIAAAGTPVDTEQVRAMDETVANYRQMYQFGG